MNTKCNLLRIQFMFIVSKHMLKEIRCGNQFETLKGNEIRLREARWSMQRVKHEHDATEGS